MTTIKPMELLHQRSVWGAVWLTHVTAGRPYHPFGGGTINAGLAIPRIVGDAITPYAVRYLVIGAGGAYINDIDQRAWPVRHESDDITPRDPLAWRIFDIADDTGYQKGYRLRKEFVKDGRVLVAYYAKVVSDPAPIVSSVIDLSTNNSVSPLSFSVEKTKPRPTPMPLFKDLTDKDVEVGRYAVTSSSLEVHVTQEDASYIREAAGILKGDSSLGVVSEVFICMGVDKKTKRSMDGKTIGYVEADDLQPFVMLSFSPVDALYLETDIGVSEPLIVQRTP